MKYSTNPLFRELAESTRILESLVRNRAPQVLLDSAREDFDNVLNELKRYHSKEFINQEMANKWLNPKWRDDFSDCEES